MSIEILPSDDFDEEDIAKIKQMFSDNGLNIEVRSGQMIQKSLESPAVLWVEIITPAVLSLSATAFFTGFFNRMGGDAYDGLKKVIKQLSQKRKINKPIQIRIHIRKDEQIIIIPLPDDLHALGQALDTLPEFLDNNPDLDGWICFDQGKWTVMGS